MSGAFTKAPNSYFVNLDLIGFVEPTPRSQYPTDPKQVCRPAGRVL
jgi:hypothetical protein